MPFHHDELPHSSSCEAQNKGVSDYGLKSPKLWARINLSFIKLFLSGICHSDEKSEYHRDPTAFPK
jgi:hypothetical protein